MQHNRASGIDRRTLLKNSAATGAALAVGSVATPALAQNKPIKLGVCQPTDRTAGGIRGSGQFHHQQLQRCHQGQHQDRQCYGAGGGCGQGQPVEPQPRRSGGEGPHRPGQDRSHAGRLDPGDHQPGLDPMRDRGGALHFQPGAVATLVHRPSSQSGRRAARLERFQLHVSFLLGARGRNRCLHQHVEPASDEQIGRRSVSQ